MARMSTRKVSLDVNTKSVKSLRNAMQFMAKNDGVQADPEIFYAVSDMLGLLSDISDTYQDIRKKIKTK